MLHHAEGRCRYPDHCKAIVECVGNNWPSWWFWSISTIRIVYSIVRKSASLAKREEDKRNCLKQTEVSIYYILYLGGGWHLDVHFSDKSGAPFSWEAFKRACFFLFELVFARTITTLVVWRPNIVGWLQGHHPLEPHMTVRNHDTLAGCNSTVWRLGTPQFHCL